MVARCSGGWPRAQEKGRRWGKTVESERNRRVNLKKKRNELSGKSVQIDLAFYSCQRWDGISHQVRHLKSAMDQLAQRILWLLC